jgi:hypothetical protein
MAAQKRRNERGISYYVIMRRRVQRERADAGYHAELMAAEERPMMLLRDTAEPSC